MNWPLVLQVLLYVASVIGALGGILGFFWWLVTKYYEHKFREIELLRQENKNLQVSAEKLSSVNTQHSIDLKNLATQLDWSRDTEQQLEEKLDAVQTARADEAALLERVRGNFKGAREKLDAEIAKLKAELARSTTSHQHLEVIRERVRTISSLDGKLWNRPVADTAPQFLPRKTRTTRIISVLNLKGGVGKTTITANLAAALSETAKVLMIDLDFQRSLSRLWLDGQERMVRHLGKRCVQHFLAESNHSAKVLLDKIGGPLEEPANCWFFPNSDSVRDGSHSDGEIGQDDSLEEIEMRLMFGWIFERNPIDIRFHLREAIHHIDVQTKVDYVLMDCPPRLTTACINGLAASDYVLVPVTLDAMATNSVPYLLKNLAALRTVLPHLEIIGVVANKVKMKSYFPIEQEKTAWTNLKQQGSRFTPSPYFFRAMIPEDAAIGRFATQSIEEEKRSLRNTQQYDKTRSAFFELAEELKNAMQKREAATDAFETGSNEHNGEMHGTGNSEDRATGIGQST